MRKKQGGQALILVLILLTIGALLIVPSLRLTSTTLKNNQIYTREIKAMYAADAGQEWILWKLTHDNLGGQFQNDDDQFTDTIDVCGIPVDITIIMRAQEGEGGITLFGDDVIRPTKTVIYTTPNNGSYQTYTYTIRLEQLSNDNTVGLDAVYDILPKPFSASDYVTGSSTLSVDGGAPVQIGDPLKEVQGGQVRLLWPATYVWDNDTKTGTGGFTSPIRDFEVRQVKELSFQVAGTLQNNRTYYNWVILKPWNTLSGADAPIITGNGSNAEGGLINVFKTSVPDIIQPGVETDIEYTISVTNMDDSTNQIQEISDYLPPGFTYLTGTSSGITTVDPQLSLENFNGVDRWHLTWAATEIPGGEKSMAAGETVTQIFWAQTSKEVSGSYYNEVTVVPKTPIPTIFEEIGITYDHFNSSYSWNTGSVLVPFYDGRTDAGQVIIDSNIALILGGVAVNSWQVR